MSWRARSVSGWSASSTDDLRDRLRLVLEKLANPQCKAIRDGRGAYYWDEPLGASPGSLAFVFAGEGAQYPGMLADLCRHFPEVRAWFDTADRVAREQGHELVPSAAFFGGEPAGVRANANANAGDGLWTMGTAVNAVLSAHWALHALADHARNPARPGGRPLQRRDPRAGVGRRHHDRLRLLRPPGAAGHGLPGS